MSTQVHPEIGHSQTFLATFQQYEYHFRTTTKSPRGGYINSSLGLNVNSGLPSERINLSPFTKDFRGGGHTMSVE